MMTMIFTSNFSKAGRNKQSSFINISIALKTPFYFTGPTYKTLAPSWDILKEFKEKRDEDLYIQRFNTEILGVLNVEQTLDELIQIVNVEKAKLQKTVLNIAEYEPFNIVLLCYENRDAFCHRHLVSKWLSMNSDLEIKEI